MDNRVLRSISNATPFLIFQHDRGSPLWNSRPANRNQGVRVVWVGITLTGNSLFDFNGYRVGFTDAGCRATEGWFASCWFVVLESGADAIRIGAIRY